MGKTYKARKATFIETKSDKGSRIFTPVNKRAKFVVKKLGKRTRVTLNELRASKGAGTYKFYAYTNEGSGAGQRPTLKAIR